MADDEEIKGGVQAERRGNQEKDYERLSKLCKFKKLFPYKDYLLFKTKITTLRLEIDEHQ